MLRIFGSKAIDTDEKKIARILNRGVEDVFVRESLEKKLKSGKQMRVKLGFDPTGPKIHIGRAIVLRKLREFQDLGHQIVFIVGDFTAQIGDPSDKLDKRPMLTSEEIKKNVKDYKKLVGKIIDVNRAEFHYNSKWLADLNLKEMLELSESFTVQQMTARRNFKDRIDSGNEISLREFNYPLLQGYDSVKVDADIEIGGFDQLFNLKAGRVVQKHYGKPEQDVLTTVMLEGTDGRKMSTSWGNVINITDEPSDMFGKVMSVQDELIEKYFLLCTDMEEQKISEISEGMKNGNLNPRDAKIDLASEIVKIYHGENAAQKAKDNFISTFSKGDVPEDAVSVSVKKGTALADILIDQKIVKSKSDFRRLIDQDAIGPVGGEKIKDPSFVVEESVDLRVGKHRFISIDIEG